MIIHAGMAETWTADDVAAVRNAIRRLATGDREVSVSFAGPPQRSVTYQMVQLQELRDLLAEMVRATTTGATSYRLGATRKGLGGPGGAL